MVAVLHGRIPGPRRYASKVDRQLIGLQHLLQFPNQVGPLNCERNRLTDAENNLALARCGASYSQAYRLFL